MFWNENILNALGDHAANNIIQDFKYEIDGVWKSGNITDRTQSNGKYTLTVEIPENESGTITGIQFMDMGNVVGQREEYIVKKSGQLLLLKLKIQVKDGE